MWILSPSGNEPRIRTVSVSGATEAALEEYLTPQETMTQFKWPEHTWRFCSSFSRTIFMLLCLGLGLERQQKKVFYKCTTLLSLLYLSGSFVKWTRWNHQKLKAGGGRDDDICLVWNIGLDLKFPAGWCRMGLIKPECISWKTDLK